MPNPTAIEEWEVAQRQLAEAEIELLRWKLSKNTPAPDVLVRTVEEARDRANFLFEIAATFLGSPHDTVPGEL